MTQLNSDCHSTIILLLNSEVALTNPEMKVEDAEARILTMGANPPL